MFLSEHNVEHGYCERCVYILHSSVVCFASIISGKKLVLKCIGRWKYSERW